MNQAKIGKFINECRKEKGLTQNQLAEKLGITDKAVSKWETGKGLPDAAIMIALCDQLGISVNELLSGERLTEDNYEEKANENIVTMAKAADKNRKRVIFVVALIGVLLLCRVMFGIYQNIEVTVDYDERFMQCELTEDCITYYINGFSVISPEYEIVNTETETLVFFTNKTLLQNKIHSHWESWDSFAQLNNGEDALYTAKEIIDIKDMPEVKEEIKVYYTDISLNKVKRADSDKLQEIVQNSMLIAE